MSAREPTPLMRFFRRMTEKLFGRYYEGPDPPDRIGDMVIAFANMNPNATRLDWVEFSQNHARECYRSGYIRGVEYAEREPEEPEIDPDEMMDALNGPEWRERPVGPYMEPPRDDPEDWSWYPEGGITLEGDALDMVRDFEDERSIAQRQLDKMEKDDEQRSKRGEAE